MHKLLFASDGIMTRHVKLENCETGKVELCFDDSDRDHPKSCVNSINSV